jgi:polysaccharide biosynthesis transport protein
MRHVPVPFGPHGHLPAHPDRNAIPVGGHDYSDDDERGEFDPLKLIWYALHHWFVIVACLVTGLVCGFVYTFMQTPLYQATASVEIQGQTARIIQDLDVVTPRDEFALETARRKMLSHDLAQRVVYELDLSNKQDFLAPTPSFSLSNLANKILRRTPDAGLLDADAEQRLAIATGKVQGGLSAEYIVGTSILSVSFRHPVPEYTAKIADQAVRSYIDQNVDQRSETSDLAKQFIEEQLAETKVKLQDSEKALIEYAQQAGITLSEDDRSLISEQIAAINGALSAALQERLDSQRLVELAENGNSAALPDLADNQSVQAIREKIAELKGEYQQKRMTLKPGYPEMQRLSIQIDELQGQLNSAIEGVVQSVRIRLSQAKEKENALRQELATLDAQQANFREKNIEYTILKREVDTNRSQYNALVDKLNAIGIGSDVSRTSNASVIDRAGVPGAPYSPNLKKNLAFYLAVFAALAAAIIYIVELFNNTFAVPDQLENELHLPVLGLLPSTEISQISGQLIDPKSKLAEAYRTLRTSVQFAGTDNHVKSILVTSAEGGEGKSTTAYQLAHDFASLGRRVLIIDADMRKPSMHRTVGIDNDIGLSNILSNVVHSGDVKAVFKQTKRDNNVEVLTAGTIPPNPADLLMSPKLDRMLQACMKIYDLVVIDSPPILGLADAPILARSAHATLLVVAAKTATRKSVIRAVKRLRGSGCNLVGCAFTKFAVGRLDYNYEYRYMHDNYYNYDQTPEQLEKSA